MTANTLQSRTFEIVRFPLILCIVSIHSAVYFEPEALSTLSLGSLSDLYNLSFVLVTKVLASIALPSFFLISGYLFFVNLESWSWRTYLHKMKRRFWTLLVPFLFWNTFYIANELLKSLKKYGFSGVAFEQFREWCQGFDSIFSMFWDGVVLSSGIDMLGFSYTSAVPVNVPLWFLRELIVLACIAPLFYQLLKRIPWITILLLLICLFTKVWIHIHGFSTLSTFYFFTGAVFSIHRRNIVDDISRHRCSSVVLSAFLTVVSLYTYQRGFVWAQYSSTLRVIITIIALFNICSWIVSKGVNLPSAWNKGSFFVYLTHCVSILWWSPLTIVMLLFEKVSSSQAIMWRLMQMLLVPIATTAVCLVFYCILSRFLPRTTRFITGKR